MSDGMRIEWASCKKCSRDTRHEVLFQHHKSADKDEYPEAETWQVIRCLGCLNVAFRYQYDDYADMHEASDGEFEHNSSSSVYPKTIQNHKQLDSTHLLPDVIRNIHKQTVTALGEEAYILASIGLRATIEATCNHLKIVGNSLERRIDQLFKGGFVSSSDKNRLHAIRFLGNDAAHEILEPKKSELMVALEIVEHLLKTVFILEKKAARLEIIAETYDEFSKMLIKQLAGQTPGEITSLAAIMGRKKRLITHNSGAFESSLIEDIKTGKFLHLTLDRVEKIDGRDIQLYTVSESVKSISKFRILRTVT